MLIFFQIKPCEEIPITWNDFYVDGLPITTIMWMISLPCVDKISITHCYILFRVSDIVSKMPFQVETHTTLITWMISPVYRWSPLWVSSPVCQLFSIASISMSLEGLLPVFINYSTTPCLLHLSKCTNPLSDNVTLGKPI